jgi:hypothetical protein
MVGYFQLLQVRRVEHFAPVVGESRLRRRIEELAAEDQPAMVEEGLVDRCKRFVVKGMVEVDTRHLSADRARESFDRNLCTHSFLPILITTANF